MNARGTRFNHWRAVTSRSVQHCARDTPRRVVTLDRSTHMCDVYDLQSHRIRALVSTERRLSVTLLVTSVQMTSLFATFHVPTSVIFQFLHFQQG